MSKEKHLDDLDKKILSILMENAKNGFETLDLPENFKIDALDRLRVWLTNDMFTAYVPQIDHLIGSGQWEFLLDSFYQVIPFGTGGDFRKTLRIPKTGGHRSQPHQSLDHPGIGPGSQPIPDQSPRRVRQASGPGAGLRCAPVYGHRSVCSGSTQPGR